VGDEAFLIGFLPLILLVEFLAMVEKDFLVEQV
jgi:hypothetical protein